MDLNPGMRREGMESHGCLSIILYFLPVITTMYYLEYFRSPMLKKKFLFYFKVTNFSTYFFIFFLFLKYVYVYKS